MSHTAQQSHVQLMVCPPHRTGLPISQFTIRCEHRNSRFVLEEQLSYNFVRQRLMIVRLQLPKVTNVAVM